MKKMKRMVIAPPTMIPRCPFFLSNAKRKRRAQGLALTTHRQAYRRSAANNQLVAPHQRTGRAAQPFLARRRKKTKVV